MSDPYAQFREEPDSEFKRSLQKMADELIKIDADIENTNTELERLSNLRRDLVEIRIPKLTEGMDGTFDIGDGREITVKEEIRASIGGERKAPAIKWLDEHGYSSIVKRAVVVEFSRGDKEGSDTLVEKIQQINFENPVVIKQDLDVHHMTMLSWVKERIKEGDDIPRDLFGVYPQRIAKIKEKK